MLTILDIEKLSAQERLAAKCIVQACDGLSHREAQQALAFAQDALGYMARKLYKPEPCDVQVALQYVEHPPALGDGAEWITLLRNQAILLGLAQAHEPKIADESGTSGEVLETQEQA